MLIDITCPHCSHVQQFQIYPQINVSNEPALKPMVLNFECFKDECESCHHIIPVAYETLYHDFDQKLLIYLDPTQTKTIQDVDELITKEFGTLEGYTIRLVDNPDDLREKIQLRDAHIDDRVMEIIKQYYVSNALTQNPNLQLANVLFNRALADHEIVFITTNQEKFMAKLDDEFAGHIKQLYQKKIDVYTHPLTNRIDSSWVRFVLESKHS